MSTTTPTSPAANRRPIVGFLIAEVFSLGGTRLSMIAVPWLVLTLTGSATMTGLVAFAEMLPYVLVKTLAGPIIDRVGAKPVAVAADALSVLTIASVPLLHLLGALQVWLLLPVVALMGALRGPADGAKITFVPTVARLAAVPLERVTGLHGAVERLATTIGTALAGGLVALIGPALALAVNALCFALAALVILFVLESDGSTPTPDAPAAKPTTPAMVRQYATDLKQGWDFLRTDAVLMGITIMVAITNMLDQAFTVVLLPVWAKAGGHGVEMVGLFAAVFSAASVLGALIAAAKADRLPRLAVYATAFLIAGAPRFLILAVDAPLTWVLAVAALAGFVSGFINPIIGAVIFERIPAALTGRVAALNSSLAWALMPFGGLLGGLLVTGIGLPLALATVGCAYFLATLTPLVRSSFRSLGTRPESVAEVR